MARLLRVRDRVLLGLALMADILDEIRLVGGFVPRAYQEMYGFAPEKYKKENLYATVDRMLKADFIEKVVVDGEPKFRLTSFGQKKFIRDFPLINLQNKSWDRKWRVLIFDIPENVRWKRDALREKLKELGFGMIQKSVWVSPHPFESDIRQFIKGHNLDSFAYLFVSEAGFVGNIEEFVERVWKIEELNEDYWELVKFSSEREAGTKDFSVRFFELMLDDPFLPREILPDPWYGDEARRLMRNIAKKSL